MEENIKYLHIGEFDLILHIENKEDIIVPNKDLIFVCSGDIMENLYGKFIEFKSEFKFEVSVTSNPIHIGMEKINITNFSDRCIRNKMYEIRNHLNKMIWTFGLPNGYIKLKEKLPTLPDLDSYIFDA